MPKVNIEIGVPADATPEQMKEVIRWSKAWESGLLGFAQTLDMAALGCCSVGTSIVFASMIEAALEDPTLKPWLSALDEAAAAAAATVSCRV